MHSLARKKYVTDKELMSLPDDGHKHELIDGELIMTPAGFQHLDGEDAIPGFSMAISELFAELNV